MSIQIRNARKELVFITVARTRRGFNARQRQQIAKVKSLMKSGITDSASIRAVVHAM